ncbi:hypothetical protein [Alloactinosynnema sp. L-07]|uniref:DUF397 domain-containing protein n=1 Tax=Alloactinosynnema sp. L-07 TaxID=1653480 RepID=UPI00065EF03B|nr:DUF397 domain-containing protein [Alloactinosynnema sp. L-07]CRK60585.1 hypothetical protein [Alloactinosynnema sp. L-07]
MDGPWRKSSFSNNQDDCVEVAFPGQVGLRDSKNPDGGRLIVSVESWRCALRSFSGPLGHSRP